MRALLIWSFVWWSGYVFTWLGLKYRFFTDSDTNRLAFGMPAGIAGGALCDIFLYGFFTQNIVLASLLVTSFVGSFLFLWVRALIRGHL